MVKSTTVRQMVSVIMRLTAERKNHVVVIVAIDAAFNHYGI